MRNTGVIILAGTQPGCTTIGRNRLWVEMARSLAARGCPTIRFDYHGLGESLGGSVEYDLNLPATEVFDAAADQLRWLGVERIVVVATCFGSRTAVAAASKLEDIAGLLLVAPPVRDIKKGRGATSHLATYASTGQLLKRAFTPRTLRRFVMNPHTRTMTRRVLTMSARSRLTSVGRDHAAHVTEAAEGFQRPLAELIGKGVPVRMLFGTDDYFYTEFERASEGSLGDLIDGSNGLVEVDTVGGVMRGFTTTDVQEYVHTEALAWVERCA